MSWLVPPWTPSLSSAARHVRISRLKKRGQLQSEKYAMFVYHEGRARAECMHVCIYIYKYTYTYTCFMINHIYLYTRIYIYICIYICIYMDMYVYIHTYVCIYIYIYTYALCLSLYVYIIYKCWCLNVNICICESPNFDPCRHFCKAFKATETRRIFTASPETPAAGALRLAVTGGVSIDPFRPRKWDKQWTAT
jgi:hypothetical protein